MAGCPRVASGGLRITSLQQERSGVGRLARAAGALPGDRGGRAPPGARRLGRETAGHAASLLRPRPRQLRRPDEVHGLQHFSRARDIPDAGLRGPAGSSRRQGPDDRRQGRPRQARTRGSRRRRQRLRADRAEVQRLQGAGLRSLPDQALRPHRLGRARRGQALVHPEPRQCRPRSAVRARDGLRAHPAARDAADRQYRPESRGDRRGHRRAVGRGRVHPGRRRAVLPLPSRRRTFPEPAGDRGGAARDGHALDRGRRADLRPLAHPGLPGFVRRLARPPDRRHPVEGRGHVEGSGQGCRATAAPVRAAGLPPARQPDRGGAFPAGDPERAQDRELVRRSDGRRLHRGPELAGLPLPAG